jgi:hypothetical protein
MTCTVESASFSSLGMKQINSLFIRRHDAYFVNRLHYYYIVEINSLLTKVRFKYIKEMHQITNVSSSKLVASDNIITEHSEPLLNIMMGIWRRKNHQICHLLP